MLNQSIYVYDNTLFYLNKLLFHVKQYNKKGTLWSLFYMEDGSYRVYLPLFAFLFYMALDFH